MRAVDQTTGRVFQLLEERKPGAYDDGFTLLFSRGADRLASADMTGTDFQLMFRLVAGDHKLAWDSWREVNQRDLAAAMGTSQATVSRSLERLRTVGVLERENRGGYKRAARWRLSIEFFWRGSTGQYWQQRKKRDAARRAASTQALPPSERQ